MSNYDLKGKINRLQSIISSIKKENMEKLNKYFLLIEENPIMEVDIRSSTIQEKEIERFLKDIYGQSLNKEKIKKKVEEIKSMLNIKRDFFKKIVEILLE